MEILLYGLIFFFGVSTGYLLKWVLQRSGGYHGIIYVTKNDEKIVYSLELADSPEILQFEDRVVFKVDASGQNLNRS